MTNIEIFKQVFDNLTPDELRAMSDEDFLKWAKYDKYGYLWEEIPETTDPGYYIRWHGENDGKAKVLLSNDVYTIQLLEGDGGWYGQFAIYKNGTWLSIYYHDINTKPEDIIRDWLADDLIQK